jgi:hypothetical protein
MKDRILQAGCLVLYAASIALWALTGFFYLFAVLLVLHVSEYFIVGRKVGEQAGISKGKAFLLCLAFGFTWWLPLKKNQAANSNEHNR